MEADDAEHMRLLRWGDAFRLVSRPAKGEPLWRRCDKGTLHTQTDAIDLRLREHGMKPANGKWKFLSELYTRDEAVLFVLNKLKGFVSK